MMRQYQGLGNDQAVHSLLYTGDKLHGTTGWYVYIDQYWQSLPVISGIDENDSDLVSRGHHNFWLGTCKQL